VSDEYLDAMTEDFDKVKAAFNRDLSSVRTGRASPQILENVQVVVASYGATMPLNQLASISAPDPRLLVVNPWDKGTISDIGKAIGSAGLGLNPASDGTIIRVPIPALTTQRRRDLVRSVRTLQEDFRVRARQVRKEYNDIFKELESDKEITRDDLKRYQGLVQDATNACIKELDGISDAKQQEVMAS